MTIDDVLDILVADSIMIAHSTFNTDFKKKKAQEKRTEAKTALLEIIKGVRPKRINTKNIIGMPFAYEQECKGFNQGIESYGKAIEELFK